MTCRIWNLAICVAILGLGAVSARAATLGPLSTFGGGDGWRGPYDILPGDAAGTSVPDPTMPGESPDRYRYLGYDVTITANTDPLEASVNSGNFERGLAYNPTTGHLILVSRNNTAGAVPSIRILDGATGVDIGELSQGSGVITGGLFTMNMIGVADDGAIYMENLATTVSGTSPFKVYRWADEAAAPTVAYAGSTAADGVIPGSRLGDSFDVFGSGAGTRLVAGYGRNTGIADTNGFSLLTTSDGSTFTGALVPVAGTDSGDFRLGITFTDADTILGKQGDGNIPGVVDPSVVRLVDVAGTAGTLNTSFSTDGQTLRTMDYAVVDGKPLLAILECSADQTLAARARLFVYDMTDPSAPLAERKLQEGSTLFDPGVAPGSSPTAMARGR